MTTNTILNAFTVDLEEWFQGLTSTNPQVARWPQFESRIEQATNLLLDILRLHQVKATFFVLGHVADHHPTLIEKIAAAGHEIAIHGYYHRFVHHLTPTEFTQEVMYSIQAVQKITGQRPLGHRAPYFSINASTPWALDVLQEQGLCYDSSFFPVRSLLYGFPRAPRFPYLVNGRSFIEFPLSTAHFAGINWPIAGGFYLRLLPYAFIRAGIRQLNNQGHPAILYHHPWELDTKQPIVAASPRERLTHYYGRSQLAAKLHHLFTDFCFVPLNQLRKTISTSQPPKVTKEISHDYPL